MHDDIWQVPEETPPEPRRSTAVRVARVVVVAAAFATIGIGGVAAASSGGSHESVTPARAVVHSASDNSVSIDNAVGTGAHHDCPFHSQSSSSQG